MRNIYINRLRTDKNGTFGEMKFDDPASDTICVTAELPWDENLPDKSCIPSGSYVFESFISPVHGQTWKAKDVPGRSNIEIHEGNLPNKDSLGCIIVGENFGELGGLPAVLNSKVALMSLRTLLPPEFMLTFQWIN